MGGFVKGGSLLLIKDRSKVDSRAKEWRIQVLSASQHLHLIGRTNNLPINESEIVRT